MSLTCNSVSLVPFDNNLGPIFLPDLTEVEVGRNRLCLINNTYCSRNQVVVKADYSKSIVTIERRGKNPSLLNDVVLELNKSVDAKDQMILEVLPRKLRYKIVFNTAASAKDAHKRMASSSAGPSTAEKKECPRFEWISHSHKYCLQKSLLVCKARASGGVKVNSKKVAAFDLDGTIIKTKSGNVFPRNVDDWTWWNPCVKDKLHQLLENDMKVVVFTNQAALRLGTNTSAFQRKIENILSELDLPIDVFVSREHDFFRKPAPGMWDQLEIEIGGGIDKTESFFVGDAAGRSPMWAPGKKKDFSCADRLFARNVGVPFFTPEEYFLNAYQNASYIEPEFDPRKILPIAEPDYKIPSGDNEGIIMVGAPASGKSSFVKRYLQGNSYVVVNQDVLKTWEKCKLSINSSLKLKKRFVIDNTNPGVTRRKEIIDMCKQFKVPVRCFIMDTSENHCMHNNRFREMTKCDHTPVGIGIIKHFWRVYEEPTLEEGFTEIVKVSFSPNFENDELKRLYQLYLM